MEVQKENLKLDMLDTKHQFIAITEKNVAIINAILKIDSNYRNSFNVNDNIHNSYAYRIRHEFLLEDGSFSKNKKLLKEIIIEIDNKNSTHLSVANGRTMVSDYIYNHIDSLKYKLQKGDAGLVNDIAKCVTNRDNFSFATKFCHYFSYYIFDDKEKDNYSIYDKVLAEVLPYYYLQYVDSVEYLKTNRNKKCESITRSLFITKNKNTVNYDYQAYRGFIDQIRDGVLQKTGFHISRTDLDHLLWYYYKGDVVLRRNLQQSFNTLRRK